MVRPIYKRHCIWALALVGGVSLAGCQQGATPSPENLGLEDASGEQEEPVRESELRAFCPSVTLREGTAYFQTYEGGNRGNPDSIIYQAAISDVTRACKYQPGQTVITVAVAGKVIPGPKGRTGSITMPIRVAAIRGDEVLYSQLFEHKVAIEDTAGATQFVFTDPDVVIPGGVDRTVQVMVGYDEGPSAR